MAHPAPLRERAAVVATVAAAQLLVAAAATELTAALGFALGRSLSAVTLAFGCAAAIVTAALAVPRSGVRLAVVATALCSVAVAAAVLLGGSTYDISWDGQAYQQSGVLAIAEGWNPFGPPLHVTVPYTTPYWVNHYAKGPWVRAAALFLATDHVESAKAWNFILAASAGLATAGALLRMRVFHAAFALAGAVLVALHPVFTAQMFSFYVDGQLASVAAALVAMVALTVLTPGPVPLIGLGSAFLLLPGVKFTGAAYAIAFAVLAGGALVAFARDRVRGAALAVALGLAIGLIVTGWNPYVTNLVREGHPLHPVAGPGGADVISGQAPAAFLARTRFEKFAMATFSAARNGVLATPVLKWPFTWNGDETTIFQSPDVRFSGFGPLFSGALVLAALAWVAALRRPRHHALVGAAVAAALLATVLMNPEPWWARYVPQFWLVPLVLAVAAAATRRRTAIALATLTLVTLAANSAVVGVNAAHRLRKKSAEVEAQLQSLAREPEPIVVQIGFESNEHRLREAGVAFVKREQLPCRAPEALAHSTTRFCRATSPGTAPAQ